MLEDIQESISMGYKLAVQASINPNTMNCVEVRVAVEKIQYEVDKLALKYAKEGV